MDAVDHQHDLVDRWRQARIVPARPASNAGVKCETTSEYLERGACRVRTRNRRRVAVSSPWSRLNAAAQRSPPARASASMPLPPLARDDPATATPRPCCVMSRKSRRRAAPVIAAAVAALSPAVKAPRSNKVETTAWPPSSAPTHWQGQQQDAFERAVHVSAAPPSSLAARRRDSTGSHAVAAAPPTMPSGSRLTRGAEGQGRPQRARLVSLLRGSRKVSGDLAESRPVQVRIVNETRNDWCRCSRKLLIPCAGRRRHSSAGANPARQLSCVDAS